MLAILLHQAENGAWQHCTEKKLSVLTEKLEVLELHPLRMASTALFFFTVALNEA